MPHVASETKAPSVNLPRNFSPRPSQANGRANGASFESMLDDNAASAADRSAPPAKSQAGTKRADTDKRADKSVDKRDGKGAAKNTSAAKASDRSAEKTPDAAKSGQDKQGAPSESKTAQADPTVQPTQAEPTIEVPAEDSPEAGAAAVAATDTEAAGQTDVKDAAEKATKAAEQAAAGGVVQPSGDKPAKDAKTDTDTDADVTAAPVDAAQSGADQIATVITPAATTAPEPPAKPQSDAIAADAPKGDPLQQVAALPVAAGKPATKTDSKLEAKPDDKLAGNVTGKPTGEIAGKPASDAPTVDKLVSPAPKDSAPQPPSPDAAQKADARGAPPAHIKSADIAAAPQATAHNAAAPTADATQPLNMPAPVQQTAPPATVATTTPAAPPSPQAVAVPLAGIAVEIATQALAGKNRFAIRLDPPELGRIEVRLDVDRDGRVTSHLVADRRDTLDLLQRDSSTLQRALQDAGLKTSDNGLQFSLRDQSGNPQPDRQAADSTRIVVEDDTLPVVNTVQTAQSYYAARRGGIDIRI